jgi:hypothetical protein
VWQPSACLLEQFFFAIFEACFAILKKKSYTVAIFLIITVAVCQYKYFVVVLSDASKVC